MEFISVRPQAGPKGSYVLWVGHQNAHTYFDRAWESVEIEIGGVSYRCELSRDFWKSSPSLGGSEIDRWIKQLLASAAEDAQSDLELVPVGRRKFRLVNLRTPQDR